MQKLVSELHDRLETVLGFGLSEKSGRVYRAIWSAEIERQPLDISSLAAVLGMARGTAYKAIAELEMLGLIRREVDADRANRVLLQVTEVGWDAVAKATRTYTTLIETHLEHIRTESHGALEYQDWRPLYEGEYCIPLRTIRRWVEGGRVDELPATLLNRISVVETGGAALENFKVLLWGRGMKIGAGRDFSGQRMGELKPFASDQYWRMANTHYHSVFKDGPMAHEFSVRFEGRDAWYQRLIMPLDGGKQLLMGSWFIDTPTNASAH